MNDEGKCCLPYSTSPDNVKLGPFWRNKRYEKYGGGNWKCGEGPNPDCKPTYEVPFVLVRKPCTKRRVRKTVSCRLPPVPKCKYFNYKKYVDYIPFKRGYFPQYNEICDCMMKSYKGGDQYNNINALIAGMFNGRIGGRGGNGGPGGFFGNGGRGGDVTNNVYADIDINVSMGNDYVNKQVINNNINVIPYGHKKVIKQNPTAYYVFFYSLLQQNYCTENTEVADGYTVRDLLMYIVEDCWGLNFKDVNGGYKKRSSHSSHSSHSHSSHSHSYEDDGHYVEKRGNGVVVKFNGGLGRGGGKRLMKMLKSGGKGFYVGEGSPQ